MKTIQMLFRSGLNLMQVKIKDKKIWMASSSKGLNNFFLVDTKKVNPNFSAAEKKKFDVLKTTKEVAEEVKKEMRNNGFMLAWEK